MHNGCITIICIYRIISKQDNSMEHYLTSLLAATKQYWDKKSLNTFHGESFTYGEMATRAAKLHLFFSLAGIEEGSHLALCARNGARWGMAFLGIMTNRSVAVPILPDFTTESLMNLVDHSDSIGFFTNTDKWEKCDPARMPKLKFVISIDDWTIKYSTDEKIRSLYENIDTLFAEKYPDGFGPDDCVFPIGDLDDLCLINYTSGSTGNPKGVMLTNRAISANVDYSQRHMPVTSEDNALSMLPMAHMFGLVIEFIYPLCNGASIYWLGKAPTPSALMAAFAEVHPYLMITVPLVLEKVVNSKVKPVLEKPVMKALTKIPGIKRIIYNKVKSQLEHAFGGKVQEYIMGGAALNPEVEKVFAAIKFKYCVGYGMTECGPLISYVAHKKFVRGSCGKAIDCTTVRIDSEDPHHTVGEIQVKGDNICIGYYKNEEATAALFTEDGYLRTGDLGIIDADGNIFIRGRSKNMILGPSGQNIYPEEIEAVVNNMPYVLESVVIERGGKLVGLVYLDEQSMAKNLLDKEQVSDLPEQIRIGANKQLPGYSQITKIEVRTEPFEKTPKMSIKRFLYT